MSVPIRLRILALLAERPMYTYEIMKSLNRSWPLIHLHLKALEKWGLIESYVTKEGERVRRYYRVKQFKIEISPEILKELFSGEEG